MKWIGLTGGMGTGKSTVASFIKKLGYGLVSADDLAHQVLEPVSQAFQPIIEFFGQGILTPEGKIDRKKLGEIVFQDKFKLKKLEALTHPAIHILADQEKQKLIQSGCEIGFYDIPLLFEKGLQKSFHKVIVVYCKKKTQIERAQKRTGLSLEEINQRLAQQIPLEQKIKAAHYTIRNDGSLDELEMNVRTVLLNLKKDLKIV